MITAQKLMALALLVVGQDFIGVSPFQDSLGGGDNKAIEDERNVDITDSSALMTLNGLPAEIKQRIAFFLSPHDLKNLAQVSKYIAHDLDVCIVSSALGERAHHRSYRTQHAVRCFAAVIPKQDATTHSMIFKCRVDSEGKATIGIWVIQQDLVPASSSDHRPENLQNFRFNSDDIVASSLTYDTNMDVLMTFSVQQNKFYQFFLTTQDHRMHYTNMTLYQVSFGKKPTGCSCYLFDDET